VLVAAWLPACGDVATLTTVTGRSGIDVRDFLPVSALVVTYACWRLTKSDPNRRRVAALTLISPDDVLCRRVPDSDDFVALWVCVLQVRGKSLASISSRRRPSAASRLRCCERAHLQQR